MNRHLKRERMFMRGKTPPRTTIAILVFLSIVFGLLGSGCVSDATIKIGFIGGTSGRVADLGISGRDAVQMLAEQYNKNGGIDGRRIELIFKDDQQNPLIAKKSVQELIDNEVVAIIGPMTSEMAMAIIPVLDKSKIPAVSPTASSQDLSGRDDYFFRVSSTTLNHATKSAAYHIKTRDMHRIGSVYDKTNRSFSENWLKIFRDFFTSHGGEIAVTIGFDSQQKRSFTEIVNELLTYKPDGILIVANSMDSALICQQVRKVDSGIPITLADWGATERLLELGGKAVEGVTAVQTFNRNSPEQKYQEFRKAFLDRFKREPGFPGVYAYDALQMVLTALKKQKKNESLKETILSVRQFDGLQSKFSFDDFGDVARSNVSISVVRNQKFIVLE